jgi:uncharacterized Zn-binding protein involved in type VI secretion
MKMSNFVVEGDSTSHGGKVITGSDRIKIRGRRAARKGDIVSCPLHGNNEIIEGSGRMNDGDRPIAVDGHRTQCGCILTSSSGAARIR